MRKLTTDEFITKVTNIHNNKYDYSKVNYINSLTKVEIICPVHGLFHQVAGYHVKGNGCPYCAGTKVDTVDFINKSTLIHSGKYDYSKVNYINNKTKVEIICPVHGTFHQIAGYHIDGNGCPRCGGSIKHTNDTFIKKSISVHGNKYDYSKVNYIKNKVKVEIGCPIHGSFWQEAKSHTMGTGCPACGFDITQSTISKIYLNNDTPAILYYIKIISTPFFKVGVTTVGIHNRFKRDKGKYKIIKKYILGAKDALDLEQKILLEASNLRYKGEPILKSGGNTEIVIKDILPLIEHTLSGYVT